MKVTREKTEEVNNGQKIKKSKLAIEGSKREFVIQTRKEKDITITNGQDN